MKKATFITLVFLSFIVEQPDAQIPPGYYDDATGTGDVLRANLENIIDDHNVQSYNSLWTHFLTTDVDLYYEDNGSVLDMYSENPSGTDPYNFVFVTDQCGNYGGEGDCYNREHSFPGSWFNDNSPMYTDLFHLYPTDGYVNNVRGNFAFGETDNPDYTSQNGSKRGTCSYPGYSGTVFEPIDEFKGDFARSYFYMATRYYSIFSTFTSPMQTGDNFSDWAKEMLIEWHQNDPVSQKEIDRNNDVFNIQGNRNPYIDHPEWVCTVFGCDNMPDSDSEILPPAVQIPSGTISSLADTEIEAVDIFAFALEDKATSDELPTRIETIQLKPAASNTADWADHIQGIVINDGMQDLTVAGLNITDNFLDISLDPYDVPNGTTVEFTLSVFLKTANIADNSVFACLIDADDHGFTTDVQYSAFAEIIHSGNDIVSNDFLIDVAGNDLVFSVQGSDTEVNEIMNPTPELTCIDENGNIDYDYSESSLLYSTGTLIEEPVNGVWTDGVLAFGDLVHTEDGHDLYFEILSGPYEVQSNLFDIWCLTQDVQNLSVNCGISEAGVSWENPDCSEEIIIVVNEASVTGTPSGSYSAHSTDYQDPLNPDFPGGGKVVYNGSEPPVTIIGLSNGTEYWFKLFSFAYGQWSAGEEAHCIPAALADIERRILISPVPANNIIRLHSDDIKINKIVLSDLSGRVLRQYEHVPKNRNVDVSDLQTGLYLLKIYFRDQIVIEKIIVRK